MTPNFPPGRNRAGYVLRGRLQEVKNSRKFQAAISNSGRGRLQEVVAYERFHL